MKNTKGLTLIELVVALGITTMIGVFAIGAYLSANRLNELNSVIKEASQKARIAQEMITRLAKQADFVYVEDTNNNGVPYDNHNVELYFNTGDDKPSDPVTFQNNSIARFQILKLNTNPLSADKNYELYLSYCTEIDPATKKCYSDKWGSPVSLYGGAIYLETNSPRDDENSHFEFIGGEKPMLKVVLNGKIEQLSRNPFYSNDFLIETEITLDNYR